MPPIGLCAQLACVWETTAQKPGNVHRFADFEDAGFVDFLVSAAAIGPVLDTARGRRVGDTILEAVRATRGVTNTNTNLGILLLMAPLAAVPVPGELRIGAGRILDELDVQDARAVYEAIRLAVPGGLSHVHDQDIRDEPTQTLRQVMALAADRDLIARQYADGFWEIFEDGLPALRRGLDEAASLEGAIVTCHLHLMAQFPDTLIARKRGPVEAEEAAQRARWVLDAGWPHDACGRAALADLDAWLRGVGHARNPGTTADLVTACLFIALRDGTIQLPSRYPWSAGFRHA
jgi:triphosphoribosyl-dephospho-CoA synthase